MDLAQTSLISRVCNDDGALILSTEQAWFRFTCWGFRTKGVQRVYTPNTRNWLLGEVPLHFLPMLVKNFDWNSQVGASSPAADTIIPGVQIHKVMQDFVQKAV